MRVRFASGLVEWACGSEVDSCTIYRIDVEVHRQVLLRFFFASLYVYIEPFQVCFVIRKLTNVKQHTQLFTISLTVIVCCCITLQTAQSQRLRTLTPYFDFDLAPQVRRVLLREYRWCPKQQWAYLYKVDTFACYSIMSTTRSFRVAVNSTICRARAAGRSLAGLLLDAPGAMPHIFAYIERAARRQHVLCAHAALVRRPAPFLPFCFSKVQIAAAPASM